jgi:hypothetical protein
LAISLSTSSSSISGRTMNITSYKRDIGIPHSRQ